MAESPDRAGPTLLTAANTPQTIVSGTGVGWPIVRSIRVVNELAVDVKITVGIYTSAADAAGRRITPPNLVLHPGESYQDDVFLPFHGATEVLYAMCDTANGATVTVGIVSGP